MQQIESAAAPAAMSVDDFNAAVARAARLQEYLLRLSAALDDCEQVGAWAHAINITGEAPELQISECGARRLLLDSEFSSDRPDLGVVFHYAGRDGVRYVWIVKRPAETSREPCAYCGGTEHLTESPAGERCYLARKRAGHLAGEAS